MSRIEVSNDELVSVRDAMRSLNRMVDDLAAGRREKYVLMKKGRMVAVVIPMPGTGRPFAFENPRTP